MTGPSMGTDTEAILEVVLAKNTFEIGVGLNSGRHSVSYTMQPAQMLAHEDRTGLTVTTINNNHMKDTKQTNT